MKQASRGGLVLVILAMYWFVGLFPHTFQIPRYVLNGGAWSDAGELVFAGPGVARTPDVPTWLQEMPNANVLSLSVEARADDARQMGPARIVTISDGIGRRNLTLGQQGADLVLRVRRPGASENGTPAYRVVDVFQEPMWRSVDVEIDGGRLRLAVDKVTYVEQEFDRPILSTWDSNFPMAFGSEIPGGERPWKGSIRAAVLDVDGSVIDALNARDLVLPFGWWEVRQGVAPIADLDRMVTDFSATDLIVNLLGFALLGPLVMLALGRRMRVVAVMATAAFLSLSIEVLQVAIPGRHPSLADFLVNVAGAALGAWFLHTRAGRSCMASVGRAFLAIS